jgi:hypothetical protein
LQLWTKNVQQTKEVEKSSTDSTSYYKSLIQRNLDSISYYKEELKKSQVNTVEFNNQDPCDPVVITEVIEKTGCNADSIKKALSNKYMSKIKMLADGTTELEGNLRSYKMTTDITQNTLNVIHKRLNETIDSLSFYKKQYELEKIISSKNKQTKTKLGYNIAFLVLIITIWTFLWERYIKGLVYSLINKIKNHGKKLHG